MPKGRARSAVLTAFACWLILLASGDDFNFARAVLPSTLTPEDVLPLDDPNSDFTESAESTGPTTTYRDRYGCTSSVGRSSAGAAFSSLFAASAPCHPPHQSSNTPLRC
ncbi:MAG TPA: hypothetical protein VH682_28455 [Gemmataceae bacterium]|jgi:hypothetical protein